jgi:hypothetical protein
MDNAAVNVITIPLEASVAFVIGDTIPISQIGAGATSVTAVSGVTLNGTDGGTEVVSGQWEDVAIQKLASNVWKITGGLV